MMPETQAMIGRGQTAPPNVFAEGLRPGGLARTKLDMLSFGGGVTEEYGYG